MAPPPFLLSSSSPSLAFSLSSSFFSLSPLPFPLVSASSSLAFPPCLSLPMFSGGMCACVNITEGDMKSNRRRRCVNLAKHSYPSTSSLAPKASAMMPSLVTESTISRLFSFSSMAMYKDPLAVCTSDSVNRRGSDVPSLCWPSTTARINYNQPR